MAKTRLTRKRMFERLGAPLRNYRTSWGSVSPKGSVILFVWKDQIEGGRILVADPMWSRKTRSSGYRERLEHLELVRTGASVFCVIADSIDPATFPRRYRRFRTDTLLEGGQLSDDSSGRIWLSAGRWVAVQELLPAGKASDSEERRGGHD